jgi:DNA-binding FadR family transcriptional regulator
MARAAQAYRRPPARVKATDTKRAAQVADQIVADVMAMGWPVGEVLGAEADLLERYDVSRAVFREAVRLVEHREVARTRRGPGGGLVITEPSVEAVIDAVVLYLHRTDARLDEVFEARIVLEEIAAELAAHRLEEDDMIRLRAYVGAEYLQEDDPRALHTILAVSSHNPTIELFVDVLNRVAMLYSTDWRGYGPEVRAETVHAHSRIAQAVLAGDGRTAGRRMRTHLEAEAEYLRRRRSTRQLLPESILVDRRQGKLAEMVARNIARLVVAKDLQPGDLVGTETELIDREGVSRAVFREAVRLLEYHHIARMRRGPGGGLFVVEPSAEGVADVAATYLARRGLELGQLSELRTALEVAIVGLAVERLDGEGRARIAAALQREAASSEEERSQVVHDLHAALANAAGNRALELVALVLIRISRLNQVERLAPKAIDRIRQEVLRTHSAIAQAVFEGDAVLARHRMRRHLETLGTFVR